MDNWSKIFLKQDCLKKKGLKIIENILTSLKWRRDNFSVQLFFLCLSTTTNQCGEQVETYLIN